VAAACIPALQVPANTRHRGGSNVLFLDGHVGRVVGREAERVNYGRGRAGDGRW
jgi:prepilin-type processing-associated H-X9-DG protein